MSLSDSRRGRRPVSAFEAPPSPRRVSPVTRIAFRTCRAPYPGDRAGACVDTSPLRMAFPVYLAGRRPRSTFEACSGFTRVTARPVAQPPKAAFVTRLRHGQLPSRAARQLPDRSTPIWVESSSTGDPRLSGRTGKDLGGERPGEAEADNVARVGELPAARGAEGLRIVGPPAAADNVATIATFGCPN
jgi:hypothetical protein